MLNVLDLFAGIGGFSLGLEQAGGFRPVAFCEQSPACQRILKKHWPDVTIFDDVRSLSKSDISERVHVVTGGFPCQDISFSGLGAGLAGDRSSLWWEFHRLIKELRPDYAIVENVPALRSRGLEEILRGLSQIGYDAEWHCIPASAFGAPHRRDRIWLITYPMCFRTQVQAEGELTAEQVLGGPSEAWRTLYAEYWSAQWNRDGVSTPADLDGAWQRLLALRWNYNMDDAPPNKPVLLGWNDWRDGKWLCAADCAVTGERLSSGYSNVSLHGSATAWMPLPPEPGKD